MTIRSPMHRHYWPIAVALAAIAVVLVGVQAAGTGFVDVDSYMLLNGTGALDWCLRHGVMPCEHVNQFALIQYLPALLAKRLQLSYSSGLHVLVVLNGLAFCGLLALMWRLGTRLGSRRIGTALVAGLLASPLLWYSHAGFVEGLAALLVALFAYALVTRASPLALGASLVLAGITKETAVVFLLLMAVVADAAFRARGDHGLTRRHALAIAGAAAAALALNWGFNLFRYGTITNQYYTQADFGMPASLIPRYVVALLVSPTGGMVFLWPLLVGLLGATVVWERRREERPLARRPAAALLALLVALLISLAAWHGPFGGAQWGSRLMAPWLPALAILAAAAYAAELDSALRRILSSRKTALAAVVVVLLVGLPQLSVTVDSSHYPRKYPGDRAPLTEVAVAPYFPDASCPGEPAPGEPLYLHCLDHWTWHRGWALAQAYRALGRWHAPPLAALYVLALALLIGGASRRRGREQRFS